LAAVLGRELTHARTADSYVQMIQNAIHLNEILVATLVKEAAGQLTINVLSKELGIAGTKEISNVDKNQYIMDTVRGKNEWVWPHIERVVGHFKVARQRLMPKFNEDNPLGERLAIVHMYNEAIEMPQVPILPKFDQGLAQMLNIIGSDLVAGNVASVHVPLKKQSKLRQYIGNMPFKEKLRQFLIRQK